MKPGSCNPKGDIFYPQQAYTKHLTPSSTPFCSLVSLLHSRKHYDIHLFYFAAFFTYLFRAFFHMFKQYLNTYMAFTTKHSALEHKQTYIHVECFTTTNGRVLCVIWQQIARAPILSTIAPTYLTQVLLHEL